MKQYDFLVIGSGVAGQKAAIQAAKFAKRTAVIERRAVIDGVAVHTGTIPSKTLREDDQQASALAAFVGHGFHLKRHSCNNQNEKKRHFDQGFEYEHLHNEAGPCQC